MSIKVIPDDYDALKEAEYRWEREWFDVLDHFIKIIVGHVASYPMGAPEIWARDRLDAALNKRFPPEPPRELTRAERERKRVTSKKKWKILARDNYQCVGCGSRESVEIDHVMPISKGGTSDDDNLQTLCKPCNTGKGVSLPGGPA